MLFYHKQHCSSEVPLMLTGLTVGGQGVEEDNVSICSFHVCKCGQVLKDSNSLYLELWLTLEIT